MKLSVVLAVLATWIGVASAQPDDDVLYACHPAAAGTKISVQFGPDTSIADLASWVIGFTCKNVVIASDVAKHATRVTVIAPQKMTPKQALQLFVDSVEATGLVVQQKNDTIIIKLGPGMPKGCPDSAAAPSSPVMKPAQVAPPVQTTLSDDEQQKLIDTGVTKVDDTHYRIKAAVVDQVLQNPMAFAKSARVVPNVRDGKPHGFKLYAIRPNSLYAKLGLQNGDELDSINKLPLDSADQALEVYTKIRDAKELTVEITRRGKAETLIYTIKN